MINALDMRIPVTYNGVTYLAPHGADQTKSDIRLPDGTLLHVTRWDGSVLVSVGEYVVLTQPTPGTPIVDAVEAPRGSTAAPEGALN